MYHHSKQSIIIHFIIWCWQPTTAFAFLIHVIKIIIVYITEIILLIIIKIASLILIKKWEHFRTETWPEQNALTGCNSINK